MIRFRAFGTTFVLPVFTLLIPILAPMLGLRIRFIHLAIALSIHEVAHILAARIWKIDIPEIRLSPFGGSARIENPYTLAARTLACIAVAGPMANLIAAIVFAALSRYGLLRYYLTSDFIHTNLMLFLLNMLPVLPLDGGRILYCLLQHPLGMTGALRTGIYLGLFFSSILVITAAAGFMRFRKLNLSLLFSAIFILTSAQDEEDALLQAKFIQVSSKLTHYPAF